MEIKIIPAYRRQGHSPTVCNAAPPAKSKIAAGGPKIANGVWKGFGRSRQLFQNKFFDLSTPSMRKGRDRGEMGGREWGIKTFLVANNVVASRPPEH